MTYVLSIPSKEPYKVTPDDELWLLRAVAYEGAPQVTVARALVNLFVWARARGAAIGKSMADTVRSYAQPVNPDHAHGGEFDRDPSSVSQSEERRARAARQTVFDDATRDAVRIALSTSWLSDITDYAAPWVDASKKYVARTPIRAGENRFWTRAPGWAGYVANGEGGYMAKVQKVRELAAYLPSGERAQVEAAIESMEKMGKVSGTAADWDLAAANTLDALYRAVAERVVELGGKGSDVARRVLEGAAEATDRVVVPVANSLAMVLALVAVLYFVWGRK